MKSVVFVAPLFREATNRYIQAFAEVSDAQIGVIAAEPADRLDPALRSRIAGVAQVRDIMDPDELVAGCRALAPRLSGRVDKLVGHLEELQVPLGDAREKLGLDGHHGAVSRNFRDKDRMKAVLRKAGVPVARSRLLTSERDLWAFVGEVGLPIVLKPPAGLGSKATFRVSERHELEEAIRAVRPSPEHPYQAEEFVTGQENTCETVSIGGRPVWRSGTHYLPGPLEVLENPWMQYCVLLPREYDDPDFRTFDAVNTAALAALGMHTGISHMEWFRRKDGGSVVSEVGARPPGAGIMPLMSQAHQVDMWGRWADLMTHDRWDPPTRKFAAGIAFFRGQGNGRVVKVEGLDQAQEEVGEWVVDRKLPELGMPKASSYEGEGWAVVRHERTDVVLKALKRLVELVKIELG